MAGPEVKKQKETQIEAPDSREKALMGEEGFSYVSKGEQYHTGKGKFVTAEKDTLLVKKGENVYKKMGTFDKNTKSIDVKRIKRKVIMKVINKSGGPDYFHLDNGRISAASKADYEGKPSKKGLGDMGPGTRYAIIPKNKE